MRPDAIALSAACRETWIRWPCPTRDWVAPMIGIGSTTRLTGHAGACPAVAYAASTASYAARTFSRSARPVASRISRSARLPPCLVRVEELRDLAGLEVHLHDGGLDDLDVPLEQGELLLLEGVRRNGQEDHRLPLHHELVHVLDEHEGLQEPVVDGEVLE